MGRTTLYPYKCMRKCRHCGVASIAILKKSSDRALHHYCDEDCKRGVKDVNNAKTALLGGRVYKAPKKRDTTCGKDSLAIEKEKAGLRVLTFKEEQAERDRQYREYLRLPRKNCDD